jgi:hypothetical protein
MSHNIRVLSLARHTYIDVVILPLRERIKYINQRLLRLIYWDEGVFFLRRKKNYIR